MVITPIKTVTILQSQNLYKLLDRSILSLKEKSILVVTSKIISICEGNTIKINEIDKNKLIQREADLVLKKQNRYHIPLTIKDNILIPMAGIDESNGNGNYILWPQNSQKTANQVRKYLAKKFHLKQIGVIITDSKTTPLRWGTTGIALAHSGFKALNNYINTKDLFGHKLNVTKANVMDGLAAAAVLVMGEGDEQTPIAIIEDVPFVYFQKHSPTKKELADLKISIKDDLYAPLLVNSQWKKIKKATI